MSNDLSKTEDSLVSIIQESGITNLIQPLIKEIYLFDTYIAGTSFIKNHEIFESLKLNDRLTLQREDNEHDEKAILVLTSKKQKLGYIPKKDNVIFSRLLDAGKLLNASVKSIDRKKNYYKIIININLVDF